MARTVDENLRNQKRQKILLKAISLFPLYGFSQTTISMVAKNVGVSTSTVLLYFPNKEELFNSSVLESLNEIKKTLFNFEVADGTPTNVISDMVNQHIESLSKRLSYLRLLHYVLGQHERFSELSKELFKVSEHFIRALKSIIEKGKKLGQLEDINPHEAAWAYLAFINGISLIMTEPSESPFWEGLSRQGKRILGIYAN